MFTRNRVIAAATVVGALAIAAPVASAGAAPNSWNHGFGPGPAYGNCGSGHGNHGYGNHGYGNHGYGNGYGMPGVSGSASGNAQLPGVGAGANGGATIPLGPLGSIGAGAGAGGSAGL
jgi:hypothetical protein